MNIVVVGHIDHGKSTLIGRLLYDSDQVAEGRVEELQKVQEEYKKRFEFSAFIDSFNDEIEEERTIDTTKVVFKGKKRLYTITDVPGHKEFLKNMLTGAALAEVGVLVVDAEEGPREQTWRHSFLLNLLGIRKVIVLINKMDKVDWKRERFWGLAVDLESLFKEYSFTYSVVPGCAYGGDNIYKKSNAMDWYKGPTLLEALDTLTEVQKEERPLRVLVQGVYEGYILGRTVSGRVSVEDSLIFPPEKDLLTVRSISGNTSTALELEGDKSKIVRGVIGIRETDSSWKLQSTTRAEVFMSEGSLREGDKLTFCYGTKETPCKTTSIERSIDTQTGEISKSAKIEENQAGIAVLATEPVLVESFSKCPELGRFTLKRKGKNVGVGIIL